MARKRRETKETKPVTPSERTGQADAAIQRAVGDLIRLSWNERLFELDSAEMRDRFPDDADRRKLRDELFAAVADESFPSENRSLVPRLEFSGLEIEGYRIIEFVKSGRWGMTMLAEDRHVDALTPFQGPGSENPRLVALKISPLFDFLPDAAADREAVFFGEVKAMLRFGSHDIFHPTLLSIYRAGIFRSPWVNFVNDEPESYGWIARPWIVADGAADIVSHAAARRLTAVQRIELLLKVAEGLGVAHDHHVLHGDVGKSNVLVDGNGRPFIVDFGLSSDPRLQSTGTPPYQDKEADGRRRRGDDITKFLTLFCEVIDGRLCQSGEWPLFSLDRPGWPNFQNRVREWIHERGTPRSMAQLILGVRGLLAEVPRSVREEAG